MGNACSTLKPTAVQLDLRVGINAAHFLSYNA